MPPPSPSRRASSEQQASSERLGSERLGSGQRLPDGPGGALELTRWRRFGHDRLYARTPQGQDVGFWDLATDTPHPVSADQLIRLQAAVHGWRSAPGGEAPDARPGGREGARAADQGTAPSDATAPSPPSPPSAPLPPSATPLLGPARPPTAPRVQQPVGLTGPVGMDGERTLWWASSVAEWLAGEPLQPLGGDPAASSPDPAVRPATATAGHRAPTVPPGTAEQDLAAVPAGARARAQAVAVRDAAPVRTLLQRLLGARSEERAWRIGADGEELVGRELAKLVRRDPRWRVLHAVPVGDRGADIDHVAIGPAGVFTINTKHHPGARIWVGGGTVLVNGTSWPYVRNSRHDATRAARLLSTACAADVTVEPAVVAVNARSLVVKTPPTGVHVLTRGRLARWLLGRPARLDPATVEAVYAAARRPSTWLG